MKFVTHHSTDVSGKGDSFARFVLGAAAAASQGVSPNDTWETKQIIKVSQIYQVTLTTSCS